MTFHSFICVLLGFDDVDSIYASPEDFRDANRRDKIKGARLLEYFVKRSHEIGVFLPLPFTHACARAHTETHHYLSHVQEKET